MARCSPSLFLFVDGVRTPVKGLVDAGAEPVFAFYLENQVDGKLTINGVNRAHYTENFAYTSLESTKNDCRSHCWLQKRPNEVSLTRCCSSASKKAGCFQPSHASFPQDQVRPMKCLVHIPPASIGYRGFVSAVGRDLTIGASR